MRNRKFEENQKALEEILDGTFGVEKHIDRYESRAIEIGDLPRAIKYNWLRNGYRQGAFTTDEVLTKLLEIHYSEVPAAVYK